MNKDECIKTIQYHLADERYNIEQKLEEFKLKDRSITTLEYMLSEMDEAIKYLKENLK